MKKQEKEEKEETEKEAKEERNEEVKEQRAADSEMRRERKERVREATEKKKDERKALEEAEGAFRSSEPQPWDAKKKYDNIVVFTHGQFLLALRLFLKYPDFTPKELMNKFWEEYAEYPIYNAQVFTLEDLTK